MKGCTKWGPMGSLGRKNILGKRHIREKRGREANGPTGEGELGYIFMSAKKSWEKTPFLQPDLKGLI